MAPLATEPRAAEVGRNVSFEDLVTAWGLTSDSGRADSVRLDLTRVARMGIRGGPT